MTPMEQARSRLLLKHMFFATFLLNIPCEINNNLRPPTAATDMRKIMYHEGFINSLEIDVVIFVLLHEMMHVMLKHGLRRNGRRPKQWNIACDYAINLQLFKAGIKLWPGCYFDMRFDGMSAEQIYDVLEQERGEGKGRGTGKGKGRPRPGAGEPGEDEEEVEGGVGEDLIEPEDLTDEEVNKITRDINQKIAQAQAAARGQMPAGMDILVEGELHPPLPWQSLLREYMLRVVQDEESWSRRNRRYSGVVLPGHYSIGMGELVMIGDTSGSMMGGNVFAQIGEEITSINIQTRPERVRVIWADDEDCSRQEIFEQGEDVVLHPVGGGGTDLRKPLRYVEQFNPDIVVLITDGYTPWPDEVPYPLIVCCTTNALCPSWARRVQLNV